MITKRNTIHKTSIIDENVTLGKEVTIGPNTIIYGGTKIGDNVFIGANSIIGEPVGGAYEDEDNLTGLVLISSGSKIRSGGIIYKNVFIGENFECGHRVTIRENTKFGKNNRIGTLCDIQGDCSFGDYVRLHSNVHIGKTTKVGNFVWIFPYVIVTNDPHPPSNRLIGVEIDDFVVIATASVLLPGVKIGKDSLVGAMSLIKKDVPEGMVVSGNPAQVVCEITKVKNKFDRTQNVYPWRLHFERGMPWEGVGYENWLNSQIKG